MSGSAAESPAARPSPQRRVPVVLAAVVAALLAPWSAQAELMLFPTRVVFERNQRAAQVELINQGKAPETYRISLVNRRMTENGEITAVEAADDGQQFADPMLRFSPRQVTIAPGSSQTVRLLLRKPAELAPGEYRSHLQFDRVADSSESTSVEQQASAESNRVGVTITALIGASIPVIVRNGETQASVTLSDVALEPRAGDAPPTLAFQIHREGNRSVYGDLAVLFTARGGSPVEISKAGGVAVYVPNAVRRARMPLQLPPGAGLSGGTLRVVYRERADAGGKTLAESSIAVP
jgi:fimbrial chaperone protein